MKWAELEAENAALRAQVHDQALNIAALQRRITNSLDAYKKYEALYHEHCYMVDRHLGTLSAYHIPLRVHGRWPGDYTAYALPARWPEFSTMVHDSGPDIPDAVLRLKQFTASVTQDAARLARHVCFMSNDGTGHGAKVVISEEAWAAQGGRLDPRLRDYIAQAVAERITQG